jgi:hypothetical protein
MKAPTTTRVKGPGAIIEAAAWKDTQVTGNARLTVWQAGSTPALHDETVTSMELVSSPARLNDGGVTGACLPAQGQYEAWKASRFPSPA